MANSDRTADRITELRRHLSTLDPETREAGNIAYEISLLTDPAAKEHGVATWRRNAQSVQRTQSPERAEDRCHQILEQLDRLAEGLDRSFEQSHELLEASRRAVQGVLHEVRIAGTTIIFGRPQGTEPDAMVIQVKSGGDERFVGRDLFAGEGKSWDGSGPATLAGMGPRGGRTEFWHYGAAADLLQTLGFEDARDLSYPSGPGGNAGELIADIDRKLEPGGSVQLSGKDLAGRIFDLREARRRTESLGVTAGLSL